MKILSFIFIAASLLSFIVAIDFYFKVEKMDENDRIFELEKLILLHFFMLLFGLFVFSKNYY